ncbi:hypothetical protein N2152v2_009791 [Parachlorella kessleri]
MVASQELLLQVDSQRAAVSPEEPRKVLIKRLVGIEGDWVTVPGDTKGRCWVEGGGSSSSSSKGGSSGSIDDSRTFGSVPLALIEGSLSYVLWPPAKWGRVEAQLPPGRVVAMGSFAATSADDDDW